MSIKANSPLIQGCIEALNSNQQINDAATLHELNLAYQQDKDINVKKYTMEMLLALAYCNSYFALAIFRNKDFINNLRNLSNPNYPQEKVWGRTDGCNYSQSIQALKNRYQHNVFLSDLICVAVKEPTSKTQDLGVLFNAHVVNTNVPAHIAAVTFRWLLKKRAISTIAFFYSPGEMQRVKNIAEKDKQINDLMENIANRRLSSSARSNAVNFFITTANISRITQALNSNFITRFFRTTMSFCTGGYVPKKAMEDFVSPGLLMQRINLEFTSSTSLADKPEIIKLLKLFLQKRYFGKVYEYWRNANTEEWREFIVILGKQPSSDEIRELYELAITRYAESHNYRIDAARSHFSETMRDAILPPGSAASVASDSSPQAPGSALSSGGGAASAAATSSPSHAEPPPRSPSSPLSRGFAARTAPAVSPTANAKRDEKSDRESENLTGDNAANGGETDIPQQVPPGAAAAGLTPHLSPVAAGAAPEVANSSSSTGGTTTVDERDGADGGEYSEVVFGPPQAAAASASATLASSPAPRDNSAEGNGEGFVAGVGVAAVNADGGDSSTRGQDGEFLPGVGTAAVALSMPPAVSTSRVQSGEGDDGQFVAGIGTAAAVEAAPPKSPAAGVTRVVTREENDDEFVAGVSAAAAPAVDQLPSSATTGEEDEDEFVFGIGAAASTVASQLPPQSENRGSAAAEDDEFSAGVMQVAPAAPLTEAQYVEVLKQALFSGQVSIEELQQLITNREVNQPLAQEAIDEFVISKRIFPLVNDLRQGRITIDQLHGAARSGRINPLLAVRAELQYQQMLLPSNHRATAPVSPYLSGADAYVQSPGGVVETDWRKRLGLRPALSASSPLRAENNNRGADQNGKGKEKEKEKQENGHGPASQSAASQPPPNPFL